MSNFRNRASEVISRGEAERGNIEPTGVPKRIYQYWLANSKSSKAWDIRHGQRKENFCHFFWVVVLWAPLMGVRAKANAVVDSKAFWPVVGVVFVTGIVVDSFAFHSFALAVGATILGILGILSIVSGLIGAISLGGYDDDPTRQGRELPIKRHAVPALLIGFPVGLPLLGLIKFFRKTGPWLNRHHDKVLGSILALATGSFFAYIVITEGWLTLLAVVGFALGVISAMVLAVYLLIKLSDYIVGRRALRRETEGQEVASDLESDEPVFHEPREPSAIAKFFSGLADFFVLTFQIIRVKKWKFCPTVEVK